MAHEMSKENFICAVTRYQLYTIGHLLFTPLHTRSKSELPPRFVDDHRHCVGKIEAPVSRNHGYADTLLFGKRPKNLSRQPTALRTKHKDIAGGIVDQVVALGAFGGYGEQAAIFHASSAISPTFVNHNRGKFMIVQSCSQQLLILQRKAQRFHEMQPCARIGAQSYDVAGVRGNFRLKEYDVEHAVRDWYGRLLFLSHPLRGKSTAKAHWYPPAPLGSVIRET